MRNVWLVGLSMLFAAAACGDDDRFADLGEETNFGTEIGGVDEQTAALSTANSAFTIQQLANGQDVNAASLETIFETYTGPNEMLSPVLDQQQQQAIVAREMVRRAIVQVSRGQVATPTAGFPDCVVITAGRVDFNDCDVVEPESASTSRVSGFIAVAEGVLEMDLDVSASAEGINVSANISGSLVVTEDSVNGRIDASFSGSFDGVSVGVQSAVIYDLARDVEGCVTGRIAVGLFVSARSPEGSASAEVVGEASFACEQSVQSVTVRGRGSVSGNAN